MGIMTQVLVLGGTGWLSKRIAERWRDAGAEVTCVARGDRPAPEGTVLVRGDRDQGAYDALVGQHWDEVVDVSSRARHVREAVAALGDRAGHWTYVSSMSVYDEDETIGLDETGRLLEPAQDGDEYDYGREKVAAEQAVRSLGERAFIVRPGLIAGPGDPSDRFGYWAAAADRAGAGPILIPERGERYVQVIDVDDLADFLAVAGRQGIVNANGDVHPFLDVLDRIRVLAGHTGALVEAPDAWLEQQGVQYWMGDRSLPLWLPADMPGFTRRRNEGYRAAGGTVRPIEETIRRVLDDERARGVDRERRAGLSRSDELALIDALRGQDV
jgi:nucleoside-diphosphate-sugar epimerase